MTVAGKEANVHGIAAGHQPVAVVLDPGPAAGCRQSLRLHLQWAGRRVGVAVRVCFPRLSLALGPRYLPTTRLTTMAAMPASTALAIGDDRMSVIGLDPDACC